MHVKGAHFMKEDVGLFDAAFFNYSAETASVRIIETLLFLADDGKWLTNMLNRHWILSSDSNLNPSMKHWRMVSDAVDTYQYSR
jgi:hypothetical protein